MQTTEAFAGLSCLDCGADTDAASRRCPSCNGALAPRYDEDALADAHERLFDDDGSPARSAAGLARFAPALPFDADTLVALSEGATPLLSCPTRTDEWGVEVRLKAEGANPTGGLVDREMAVAVTAAREQGADGVVLPTTGAGGQAAAAYAARAGLGARAFVPSRSAFDHKAMINVHGGEMDVVGGRYPDALAAFADRSGSAHSLAPFETPYRHEGAKTLAYELADCDPDVVVHPTSHGIGLVGLHRGFRELAATGVIDRPPRLYAAQSAGCAPVTEAWEDGRSDTEPVEYPDTICGSLEVADPAGGSHALDALEATDGGAVAVDDDRLLDAALDAAQAGLPVSATGGTAVAAGTSLAERDAFEDGETVVLVDPATANRETDLLRSRLMSEGV
jgi:threonine synthase